MAFFSIFCVKVMARVKANEVGVESSKNEKRKVCVRARACVCVCIRGRVCVLYVCVVGVPARACCSVILSSLGCSVPEI